MTLRFLLTLEIVFLLAGTSSPGRTAVVGVVVEAYRAHLGGSEVSPGATVYDGAHFSTEEGGTLGLRCTAALLELAEKSLALVRHAGNAAQGLEAEAELVQGTLVFSTARAGELEIEAREAHIRPAGNGRTVAQVSVVGPKELRISTRRGALQFSYRGETETIAEGASYRVFLDPSEDDAKKKGAYKAARQRKTFLFIAIAGGAVGAGVGIYESRGHKHMESPDRP